MPVVFEIEAADPSVLSATSPPITDPGAGATAEDEGGGVPLVRLCYGWARVAEGVSEEEKTCTDMSKLVVLNN